MDNFILENGEHLDITEEQKQYLLDLGLIYDAEDGSYHITDAVNGLDDIENQLIAAGLVG